MWNTDGEAGKHYHSSSSAGIRGDPVLSGLPPGLTVRPVWETERSMNGQKQETPPTNMAGFLKAYAVTSCKVDGNGRLSAECKVNLLENPDAFQL